MNILTVVSTLLLIFSITAGTIFEKTIQSEKIETSYITHMSGNRKLLNQIEVKKFQKIEPLEKKEKKQTAEKTSAKQKKRPPLSCGKINIYPLLIEGKENHPFLYKTLGKLIYNQYCHAHFFYINKEKALEYQYIDALIKAAKLQQKQLGTIHIEKLDLMSVKLQTMHYFVLKGTQNFRMQKNGFPSLFEFISCNQTNKKHKICLYHAQKEILESLFNKEVSKSLTKHFDNAEASPLSKEALESILQNARYPDGISNELLDMLELQHSSKKSEEKIESFYSFLDETKHILIQKRL